MRTDDDVVRLSIPGEFADQDLVVGLRSAVIVPNLRSTAIQNVIAISVDSVSIASGVATIVLAKDQVSDLIARLLGRVRRKRSANPPPRIQITVESVTFVATIELEAADDVTAAVAEIVAAVGAASEGLLPMCGSAGPNDSDQQDTTA